jgi:hypothetical protein
MTIETRCDHCEETIATLAIIGGQPHPGITYIMRLEEDYLKCKSCPGATVSLRVKGGTCQFGATQEETAPIAKSSPPTIVKDFSHLWKEQP